MEDCNAPPSLDNNLLTVDKIIQSHKFSCRQALYKKLTIRQQSNALLEFGVYKGNSINWMAKHNPKGKYYGFDSFEGLPTNWKTRRDKGMFKTDFNALIFEPNVEIIRGTFEDTLPVFVRTMPSVIESIKCVHIDCDVYESTKTIFNVLGPTLVRNGCYVLFDEMYNYRQYEQHEFRAFNEFLQKKQPRYNVIGHTSHQQVLIKFA